ncbi:hypothetical protein BV20DRAFT_169773 [Pilatotrama ljubarskyi]|nr:hypothetical protein BV20DRAFT_169773 [Pilatotrama ljubarskyi]
MPFQLQLERVDDFPGDGWSGREDMLSFWMGWEAWLAARGFKLSLGEASIEAHVANDWRTPDFPAPASMPYAHCVRTKVKNPWHGLFSRPAVSVHPYLTYHDAYYRNSRTFLDKDWLGTGP